MSYNDSVIYTCNWPLIQTLSSWNPSGLHTMWPKWVSFMLRAFGLRNSGCCSGVGIKKSTN